MEVSLKSREKMVLDRKEWKAKAIYYPKLKVRSSGLNSTVTDLFSFDTGTGKILVRRQQKPPQNKVEITGQSLSKKQLKCTNTKLNRKQWVTYFSLEDPALGAATPDMPRASTNLLSRAIPKLLLWHLVPPGPWTVVGAPEHTAAAV